MNKKPIVVNLFAGPGAGKSTTAAGVFYELKLLGMNVELVLEYAKDITWEGNYKTLENQIYVFANQQHRQERCSDQVDIIVTDSPLILSSIYANKKTPTVFHDLVKYSFREYDNMNYFLNRVKPYTNVGRRESEEQAKRIDDTILSYLEEIEERYTIVDGDRSALLTIVNDVVLKTKVINC